MTHFEYVTVAFSIVVALCIARCLDALPSSIQSSRRYWVHTTWVLVKLINVLVLWWLVWGLRAEDWTYASFIALLFPVVLIYLQITYLVTTEPNAIEDWRSHYYEQRRQFFGLNVLLTAILAIGNLTSPVGPSTLISFAEAGLFAGSIAAAVSDDERVQAGFAVYAAIANVVAFSLAVST